ncbi:MAG: hypothetical protein PUF12_12635 [Thermoflexaceae bacterium]|nr:hypothetical protein [Thermoflexaceae bacterium]
MEKVKKYEDYKMNINKEYIYRDFGKLAPITDELRLGNASKVFTGGVRINNSMYRTDEETKEYINRSLTRKLP